MSSYNRALPPSAMRATARMLLAIAFVVPIALAANVRINGGQSSAAHVRYDSASGDELVRMSASDGWLNVTCEADSSSSVNVRAANFVTEGGIDVNVLATQLAAAEATISTLQSTPTAVPGEMRMFAGQSAPTEWLMCDGAAVSRTTYSALFAVIGITYGAGDGSTTFNVPDLRGRSPLGAGLSTASGVQRSVGETGGADSHVMQSSELPSHSHSFSQSLSTSSAGGHSHTFSTSAGDHTHGYPLSPPGNYREHSTPLDHNHFRPFRSQYNDCTQTNAPSWCNGDTFYTNSAGAHSHSGTTASESGHVHSVSINGNTGTTGSGAGHNNMMPFLAINFIIKT